METIGLTLLRGNAMVTLPLRSVMALDFVAGCFGGCAGVLVGHPFDTIKVLLQTQNPLRPCYRGTVHCMQSILQKDGVAGLYRGMSSPMCGVALINAVMFGVHGNVQRRLADPESLAAHFCAGAVAGAAQSVICSPVELAKIHMQARPASAGAGPLRPLLEASRRQGPRGVFRGLAATAARDSMGIAVYFVSFEWLSRVLAPEGDRRLSTVSVLLAGGLAGTASWISTFPVDVIKTRLQMDGSDGRAFRYQGFWDCWRQSVRAEGVTFLSRGLASTLLRAFPVNAATFAVVTWVLRMADVEARDAGVPLGAEEPLLLAAVAAASLECNVRQLGEGGGRQREAEAEAEASPDEAEGLGDAGEADGAGR